jgi:hypothetical protein
MGYFIHVWTSDRIFTPKIRAALRSQVFNLIGNILRGCTYSFKKNKNNKKKKPEIINGKNNKVATQKVYEVWRNSQVLKFYVLAMYMQTAEYYILYYTIVQTYLPCFI